MQLMNMTGYAEVQSAGRAMKIGADDYLETTIVPSILKEKEEQALTTPTTTTPLKRKVQLSNGFILGKSAQAKSMYNYIERVAPTRMSVLILGESGTGKEYAARMIHELSARNDKPFIAVDCGSLSKELAPSELFGHLKGSFTSATDNKVGIFEQAEGGTVFLDEIGNLSYEVQVQLLRALQEQKVRRVGATHDVDIDVRILAATNEDLEQAIGDGMFREDLYHRLNELSLYMPALRDRVADISIFANAFLEQANRELEKSINGFTPAALQRLEQHHWSGNLREMRNVVRRAVLFAQGETITVEDLPEFAAPKVVDMSLHPGNERQQIEAALRKARGNKTLAAQLLKIDRKTLYNKMHQLGINL